MNTPIPLYTPTDIRAPFAYACPACGMMWRHIPSDDYAEVQASRCCSTTCHECGSPKPIHGYCSPCADKQESARDAKAYAAAEKITEWTGPVYNHFTDRYYADIDEALEAAEDAGESVPYLWPCDSDTAQVDPVRVVESITEDMHEDYEVDDYEGLVAFCKAWNAKQTGVSWTQNTARVIVVEPKP